MEDLFEIKREIENSKAKLNELQIFDSIAFGKIVIRLKKNEIFGVLFNIFQIEHSGYIFNYTICKNRVIVHMPLAKGRIKSGNYEFKNGELKDVKQRKKSEQKSVRNNKFD